MSESMKSKLVFYFVRSVGVLLLATAIAKIVSACGSAHILQASDPILSISFRDEFWIFGVIELIVAAVCFSRDRVELQAMLVAFLATNFAAYRIGLLWIGYRKYCSCMGNLTDALHIPPQTADLAMKIILAYLLIGSYASLFWLWRQRKKTISASLPAQ